MSCLGWVFQDNSSLVSGNDFSVVQEAWGSDCLNLALRQDCNLYKLRRAGNDGGFALYVDGAMDSWFA